MANGIVLNIDTTKSEFQNPMVQLRQGDGNYQSLSVTVTSNGEPLDLTGWTITFMGTTAGNFKIVDTASVVTNALQGEFTYTPTKAWGQDQGEFKNAYFKFVKSDETASGASFRVNVLDAVDLTAEESKDYISVVDVMIEQVKNDMDTKLADTKQTLTDTQSQANAVHENVNDLNTNVNDLKAQNNNIRTSDNTWTGTNTFNLPIVGNISGTATTANDPQAIHIDDFGIISGFKQPIGTKFVDKLNNEFEQRAVNIEWFPILAPEATDDGRIQRAIDYVKNNGTLIFQSGATYTIATGVKIQDKNGITIIGNNATINVSSTLDNMFVFSYIGTVDNLDISGFNILNSNPDPNKHLTAFGSNSNNILTRSNVHDNIIDSMNVGISLNADLGGTVEKNNVYRNRIYNVSGSESGQGYGIHIAYGNKTEIYENYIDNAGRHAIYIAEGFDIRAQHNIIRNHRLNKSTNQYRPAINIARKAVNIIIENNIFDNIRDGAIQVGNQNEKGDMENVYVKNNSFINWKTVPAIRVGSDAQAADIFNAYNIIVSENTFVSDSTFSAVIVNMGLGVIIKGNNFKYNNPSSRIDAVNLTPTIANALDNVLIQKNTFQVASGTNKSQFRAVTFSGLASTGTVNVTASDNEFIGLYSDTKKEYFDYFSGVAITNPNLNYLPSRTLSKKTTAPTTGYHDIGEISYSSNPSSTRNVGWVCTVAGNPGTWVSFGTF